MLFTSEGFFSDKTACKIELNYPFYNTVSLSIAGIRFSLSLSPHS